MVSRRTKHAQTTMRYLEVLVADRHPLFALGLQTALAEPFEEYAFHVQGVANNASEVRDLLDHKHPDVLLIDFSLSGVDSPRLFPEVKKDHANIRILVMAGDQKSGLAREALAAGADGFMLKSGSRAELLHAIGQIMAGKKFLGENGQGTTGHNGLDYVQHFAARYGLTSREMEILRHIAQARDNHEIGRLLYISHQTVSVHRKNIMRKMGVNSTASLIKIAFENQLF